MNIITKDGKDYLRTLVYKADVDYIECSKFFEDLKEAKQEILQRTNKSETDKIGYGEYGSQVQSILNRFSNTYFSPSFMKSYLTNPATALLGSTFFEAANDATAIGTTVHKILELYYSQKKEDRKREDLLRIMKENEVEGQDQNEIRRYIEGYIPIKDYLNEDAELDDTTLNCFCEQRGKADLIIPKFNVTFPMQLSYVVDRIDIRDGKAYILDYKTGYQGPKSATFDGYLASMILYKWAVENEFSLDVAGGYLIAPGNKEKYIPLDYSLVNESKVVDQMYDFYNRFQTDMDSMLLPFTNAGYFTSDDAKKFREFMNSSVGGDYDIDILLGDHVKEQKEN